MLVVDPHPRRIESFAISRDCMRRALASPLQLPAPMRRAALAARVALVLVPACGAELGDSTPNVSQFLDDYLLVQCNEAFSCQDKFTGTASAFADEFAASSDACVQKYFTAMNGSTFDGEIAAGRLGYDGTAADHCLHELVFGDCTSFFQQGVLFGDACYHVFTPEIGTGGGCYLDYSCKSGSCDPSNHACK
jgi:hypothetical protein